MWDDVDENINPKSLLNKVSVLDPDPPVVANYLASTKTRGGGQVVLLGFQLVQMGFQGTCEKNYRT